MTCRRRRPEEWAAFEACYRGPFGDRLHVVRGNHDAYRHQSEYAGDQWIELPGVAIALLDTTIPGATTGAISSSSSSWLDDQCVAIDGPVIVMGHHQQWIGRTRPTERRLLRPASRLQRRARRAGAAPPGVDRLHRRPHAPPSRAADDPVRGARPSRSAASRTSPARGPSTASTTAASCRSSTGCPHPTRWRGASSAGACTPTSASTTQTYALGTLADRCFTIPLR